jgi:hypothetical protein
MKPLLKSYVAFVPVENGVYFEAGLDSFFLKGRGIFPLVTRMASLLDGTRPVTAIESVIPEKARPLFALLLAELERKQMVHMVPDAAETALPGSVEDRYASSIHYLKDQTPNWFAVFRRWRETPILAAGAGLSYRVMVRNLLRSGVRHLLLALDASEDPSADRSAVAASVAEAAGRDEEIVVQWLDSASAVADAATGGARIVYVSDDVPLAEGSLFRRLIALERPGTLAGGIVRGSALVGPEFGDGIPLLSTWDRFSAEGPGLPYSRATRAILGSVVAFETLKSLIFDESTDPGQRGWLQRHCYRLHPDTTIEVHSLAPPGVGQAGAPAPAEANAAGPDDDPLFDPVTGSLRWDDFAGAEFPLPHRAIAIRTQVSDGGPTPDPVTQWALSPQDLDERATARALEALAEADRPAIAAAGCSSSPVVAARDEAVWREEARAQAIARHAMFLSGAAPVRIDPETVADQDARMLLRLVRLYTGAVPRLWLLGGTGCGACVACVDVDGQLSRAAAATAGKAILEALGDALSALQLGRPPDRQRQPFLGPLEGIRPVEGLPPTALDQLGSPGSLALRFDEIRLVPGGVASRGWVVGRVQACL